MDEARGTRRQFSLTLRGRAETLGTRTWVMGVLNVTPDSFSDGGSYATGERALERGLSLFEAGADILDIGGESTRPGAAVVPAEEERRRVVPVIAALRAHGAGPISVDTTKAEVAAAALDAGADIVNDVSGFRFDPRLATLVASRGVPAVLMHLRGDFGTMHRAPAYDDVMGEVRTELGAALRDAGEKGVAEEQVIVDPGIGFAKDAGHSLEVVRRLPELRALGRPILAGPSRKSFLGKILGVEAKERLMGTAAAVAACILGGAHIVRIHDVRELMDVVRVSDAVLAAGAP
jgi:dihydropteroate synthase